MQFLLLVVFLAVFTIEVYTQDITLEPSPAQTLQQCTKHGYTCEEVSAPTDDGYTLVLHHITKAKNPCSQEKPPALLWHDIGQLSTQFVVNEPDTSLGFLLADICYDVWMGNARGNEYSVESARSPTDFWDFSWEHIAKWDLSAAITKILQKTGGSKVTYVGVGEGALAMFVKLSNDTVLNDKVKVVFALAPTTAMKHLSWKTYVGLKEIDAMCQDAYYHMLSVSSDFPFLREYVSRRAHDEPEKNTWHSFYEHEREKFDRAFGAAYCALAMKVRGDKCQRFELRKEDEDMVLSYARFCTPSEYMYRKCVNDAQCHVPYVGSKEPFCTCQGPYMGRYCEVYLASGAYGDAPVQYGTQTDTCARGTTSYQNICHFAQQAMQQLDGIWGFDYGDDARNHRTHGVYNPRNYVFSNIDIDTFVYYSEGDYISTEEDVLETYYLPFKQNRMFIRKFPGLSHIDFLNGTSQAAKNMLKDVVKELTRLKAPKNS